MSVENRFAEFINNHVHLDDYEREEIAKEIQIKEFEAGQVLLKEGMVSRNSYFNLKGCVRRYYFIDGEEKTTFFYTKNQFITSFRSFIAKTPSDHYLECVEACTLAIIPVEVEKKMLEKFPKLELFARKSLEQELANHQEMLSSQIMSSPEQRYITLLKNRPDLFQRVPQYQLASFIGVKPESLSRIRNRVAKKRS